MPWQQKCRYGPLCLLVPRLGASKLLEQRAGLSRELLRCMTEHALAPHVRSTCEQHVEITLVLCLHVGINFENNLQMCTPAPAWQDQSCHAGGPALQQARGVYNWWRGQIARWRQTPLLQWMCWRAGGSTDARHRHTAAAHQRGDDVSDMLRSELSIFCCINSGIIYSMFMFILQLIIKHQLQRDPSSLKYMLASLDRDQNNGTHQSTYKTYISCIRV